LACFVCRSSISKIVQRACWALASWWASCPASRSYQTVGTHALLLHNLVVVWPVINFKYLPWYSAKVVFSTCSRPQVAITSILFMLKVVTSGCAISQTFFIASVYCETSTRMNSWSSRRALRTVSKPLFVLQECLWSALICCLQSLTVINFGFSLLVNIQMRTYFILDGRNLNCSSLWPVNVPIVWGLLFATVFHQSTVVVFTFSSSTIMN
jgi:hypothetical protein